MIKIFTIIGARPQIIKAAALSRAIQSNFSDKIHEVIVHTGQHYDANMSSVFFEELGIPKPDHNLNIGSGSHGDTTGRMIIGLENLMLEEKPNYVVLYGDTNSTLAGSIAASKLHIPIVHIEAGLRSFNKKMPEEINRIMCDHASTLLFTPTKQGFDNLLNEGFKINLGPFSPDNPGVFHCGDIMYDNSKYFSELASKKISILEQYNINEEFVLCTIHRAENTDLTINLTNIFEGILAIADKGNIEIVIPLHPRTLTKLKELNNKIIDRIRENEKVIIIEPVSFLEMIVLEQNCFAVITDSGGVQKEAYFFKKPCLILRQETEWVEIVEVGSAFLVGTSDENIFIGYEKIQNQNFNFPELFGDGNASGFILNKILENNSN